MATSRWWKAFQTPAETQNILPFPITRFWRQLLWRQRGARLHGTQAMALGITTFQAALRARSRLAALGSGR